MNLIELRRIRLLCLAPADWRGLRVSAICWPQFLASVRLGLCRQGADWACTGAERTRAISDTSHHAKKTDAKGID